MRDTLQVQLTPAEYAEYQRAERERLCGEVIAEFARYRETEPEWYRWVRDGCPRLSAAEYAEVGKFGKPAPAQSAEQLQVGA